MIRRLCYLRERSWKSKLKWEDREKVMYVRRKGRKDCLCGGNTENIVCGRSNRGKVVGT